MMMKRNRVSLWRDHVSKRLTRRLRRRARKKADTTAQRDAAAHAAMFEPLEPRLLMSATALSGVDDQVVNAPINDQVIASLTSLFDDPEASGTIARFESVLGTIFVDLFDAVTPITVANFLSYVTSDAYNDPVDGDNFIHRSIPGFVVQGGGFNWNGATAVDVDTAAAIVNEFANFAVVSGGDAEVTIGSGLIQLPAGTDLSGVGTGDRIHLAGRADGLPIGDPAELTSFFDIIAVNDANDTVTVAPTPTAASQTGLDWFITHDVNTRGTVSMAKLGGDPDSATSQWFFSLSNNADNLDIQNGGFTAFGQVIYDGMTVVDAIAALSRVNAGSAFTSLPVIDFQGGSVTTENLVRFTDISVVEELTFAVTSSNPAVATAALVDGELRLTSGAGTIGKTTITVTATDVQGNEAEVEFDVIVPGLSIDDAMVDEDAGTATVFVRLSDALDHAVTVDFSTQGNTATAGADYTTTAGTLTFNPGETVKEITVAITNDGDADPGERFLVNLSNASAGVMITDTQAEVKIVDDEVIVIDINNSEAAEFVDSNGDTVKITLKGDGTGQVFIPSEGVGDALRVVLTGTTDGSSLSISARGGDGRTSLDDILVTGDLKSISGKTTDILGDVIVSGTVDKIQLGDIADNHLMSIGGVATDEVSIELGRVVDLTVMSSSGIKSLKAIDWQDNDADPDMIVAPWIGSLETKGDRRNGIDGDFEAGVTLSGEGDPRSTLGKARFAGSLSGVDFMIVGESGEIRGVDATNVSIDVDGGSFRGVRFANVAQLTIDAEMDIRDVRTESLVNAMISAGGTIKGIRSTDAAGLTVDVGGDLSSLRADSLVIADVDVDGELKSARFGATSNVTFDVGGALQSLRTDALTDAIVNVIGELRSLRAAGTTGLTVNVGTDLRDLRTEGLTNATVTVGGELRSLRADDASNLTVDVGAGLSSLRTGMLTTAQVDVGGELRSARFENASDVTIVAGGELRDVRAEMATGVSLTAMTLRGARFEDTSNLTIHVDGELRSLRTGNLMNATVEAGSLRDGRFEDVTGVEIDVDGETRSVRSGNWTGGSIDTGSLSSGRFGSVSNLELTVDGDAGKVESAEWIGGSFEADTLRDLATKGDRRNGVDGDANLDVLVHNAGMLAESFSNVKIAGAIIGGVWNIAGGGRSVLATSMEAAWSLVVGGDVGKFDSRGDMNADVTAMAIVKLTVRGDMDGATVSLLKAIDPLDDRVESLGSLSVSGTMNNSTVNAAGHIGGASIGRMIDSRLAAGVMNGVAGLPDDAGDFDALASIGKVSIKGVRGIDGPVFARSNIAAHELDALSLDLIDSMNSGVPFGVATSVFNGVKFETAAESFDLRDVDDVNAAALPDDFIVRIL